MNDNEFIEPLRAYIAEVYLDGSQELTIDSPLLDWGVVDSLTLPDLVQYVEDKFGIDIPQADISPANFRTLADLGKLLVRLRAEAS